MVRWRMSGKTSFLIMEAALIFNLITVGSVGAATYVSSCQVINSSGIYVLTANITDSSVATCINITSSDVVFDGAGYTIDGTDVWYTYGVAVNSTTALTNVTVKNLIVTDWDYGIYYKNTQNGSIENNTANSNEFKGIYLYSSSNNTLADNTANSNNDTGIYLYSSSNNTLANNTANSNTIYGIYLTSSDHNTLADNTANSNNYVGIYLYSSNHNTLTNNIANLNLDEGISEVDSTGNTFIDNYDVSNDTHTTAITSGGGGGGGGSPSPIGLLPASANELTSATYYDVLITLSASGEIDKDKFVETSNTLAGPLLLTKRYPLPTDPTAAQFARTVTKVTGDVYALAAEASQETRFQYGSLENKLVIARGDLGVDSMAAVAYAKAKNIPILLVKPNELPTVTKDAISKMMDVKQRDIIIIGGPIAVSTAVEDKLKAMGDVKRIYGETRIETALALAKETYTDKNKVRVIVITDYANPKIDAVLMSYVLNAPLLYVKSDGLSPIVKEYILNHKNTIFGSTKVVLLGVDPKVASEINELVK